MDIQKHLPRVLRSRFDSLGAFVSAVLTEIEDSKSIPKNRRLKAQVKQDIALLVFVVALRRILEDGTRAAEAASNEAKALGFSGFSVGQQIFSPGNANTRRGAVLAQAMWEQLHDERLKALLDSEISLGALVRELYAVAKQPSRLDRYRSSTPRST